MSAPALWGVGILVDRYVLFNRLMDYISYDIFTIWLSLAYVVLVILTVRVSFAFDAYFIGTAVGVLYAMLFILYDYGMMKKEATDVSSIIYINPLFVAVLSWVFLKETLDPVNYLGIVLLTLSAIVVSYRRITRRDIALLYVFIFALGVSIGRVVGKSVLGDVDVWSYLFWVTIGNNIGAIILTVLPLRGRQLRFSITSQTRRSLSIIVLGSVAGFVGYVLFYKALSLGSVTVASGITALLPSYVLVYSSLILLLKPNSISGGARDKSVLLRRLAAVLLIAAGTWALVAA